MNRRLVSCVALAGMLSGCASPPEVKVVRPAAAPLVRSGSVAPHTPGSTPVGMPPSSPTASAIQIAKQKTAASPLDWRGFNELGLAYTRAKFYDEAIASFEQALALHPITTTIEAERKQQAAIDAHQAAETAERQRIQKYQQDQQDAASMNMLFSGLLSTLPSMPGASPDSLAMLPTLDAVSRIASQPSVPDVVATPRTVIESQLKPKREVAEIYYNLGVAHYGKGTFGQAVQALDNSLSFDPSRVEALWWEAEANYRQGSYQKCIVMMNRYLALGNIMTPAPCYLRLAEAFRALGLNQDADRAFLAAVTEYKRQIAASPDDITPVRQLALSYMRQDHYPQAKKTLEESLALNETGDGLLDLATLQLIQGQYQEAQQSARKALTLHDSCQDPSRAWYLIARANDELGAASQAQDAYRQAATLLENLPMGEDLPFHAPVVFAAVGRYKEARKNVETELAKDPLGPDAAMNFLRLGLVCEKGGQDVDAIESLNRLLSLQPRYTLATAMLNRLTQKNLAACQQAISAGETAVTQKDPATAIAQFTLAFQLMGAGPQKEQLLRKILHLAGTMDSPPPLTMEAQSHYLRGNAALKTARDPVDLDRAISEFQWAATYSPWVATTYLNMSAAYSVRVRYGKAIEALKLFLTASPKTKNVEEILGKLAELEYKQEESLRTLYFHSS